MVQSLNDTSMRVDPIKWDSPLGIARVSSGPASFWVRANPDRQVGAHRKDSCSGRYVFSLRSHEEERHRANMITAFMTSSRALEPTKLHVPSRSNGDGAKNAGDVLVDETEVG